MYKKLVVLYCGYTMWTTHHVHHRNWSFYETSPKRRDVSILFFINRWI